MANVFESGSGEEMGKHPAPVGAPIGPPPKDQRPIEALNVPRIVAVFQGQDGSMGFRHGERYTLLVSKSSIRHVNRGPWIPYDSLQAFFLNWIVTGTR